MAPAARECRRGRHARCRRRRGRSPSPSSPWATCPYRLPDDYARYERLHRSPSTRAQPAFTIHVGDIKSGGDALQRRERSRRSRDYFATFEHPLIYTPGDNEWTDCHRKKAGGFDPLERLAKLREHVLHRSAEPGQGDACRWSARPSAMPAHETMVENGAGATRACVLATVHAVGSNNGFERTGGSADEYFAARRRQHRLDRGHLHGRRRRPGAGRHLRLPGRSSVPDRAEQHRGLCRTRASRTSLCAFARVPRPSAGPCS